MPTNPISTGRALHNPLVIFGLLLLAGDGPLIAAYALASDATQRLIFMIATIVFVFGMGTFFCYLVACKPRHLYAPNQIPESALGRNIYFDPKIDTELSQETIDTEARLEQKIQKLRSDLTAKASEACSQTVLAQSKPARAADPLPALIERAINDTRAAEQEAGVEKELVRAKTIILDQIASHKNGVNADALDGLLRNIRGFSRQTLDRALQALLSKGIVEMASTPVCRISTMVGRIAERKWEDGHWLYRLEGDDTWIREDNLEAVD